MRASGRVPDAFAPNRIAELLAQKRTAGRPILDLTSTNPTRAGLDSGLPAVGALLADPRALLYDPDPRGIPEARRAVASYLARRASAPVDPGRIVLTASTSEAYAHLFRLLCDPGDVVLVPRPSYPLLEPLARLESVEARAYRLAYQGMWRLDVDSLEAAVDSRTRAVVLVEPNNPTGSCLDSEELEQVESVCRDRGLALIVDEVFGEIGWPEAGGPLPSRLGGRSIPTFVLGGISKPCGLPQLKLGWIAADGPEEELERLLPGLEWILDLFLSVGTPVQWSLPKLLEGRFPYLEKLRARLAENLAMLDMAATRSGGGFERYRGEGGLSAIVRAEPIGLEPEEDLAAWALRTRDVHVHPAHFYDLERDDLAVVSLITPPDVLREALERITAP